MALATLVGCVSGIAVSAMTWLTQTLRELLYGLPAGTRLSAADAVTPTLLLVGPCLGGALLGLVILAPPLICAGPRKRPAIDPIEANALHGGRMSLRDSVYLALQNVISNGCGASVGLEAGYTQIASASPRGWESPSRCGGATCAPWSAAARPARSRRGSARRWPAPSTPSS